MASNKSTQINRHFSELDSRFTDKSINEVMRYIDGYDKVINTNNTTTYVAEPLPSEQMELYQNSNIFLDSGKGRISTGLRGLELLSRLCKGVPQQNLFLFNNVIYASSPQAVKSASKHELTQIVISNLGLYNIIQKAEMVTPSLVQEFKDECYRIGILVKSGDFHKHTVESSMRRYGKRLAVAASRAA